MKVAFATSVTDFATTDVENLASSGGQRFTRTFNDKMYRWVKNATGADLVAGYAVFWGTNDTTKGEVYKMNQSTKGTSLGQFAGIAMSAIPSGSYGWIQTRGYNASVFVEGTTDITAFATLKGVNDQFYLVLGAAVGTAPLHVRTAIATVAFTTDATGNTPCEIRAD